MFKFSPINVGSIFCFKIYYIISDNQMNEYNMESKNLKLSEIEILSYKIWKLSSDAFFFFWIKNTIY